MNSHSVACQQQAAADNSDSAACEPQAAHGNSDSAECQPQAADGNSDRQPQAADDNDDDAPVTPLNRPLSLSDVAGHDVAVISVTEETPQGPPTASRTASPAPDEDHRPQDQIRMPTRLLDPIELYTTTSKHINSS